MIDSGCNAFRMRIFAQQVFDGERFIGPATVEIVAGRIASVTAGSLNPDQILPCGTLGPGLIDLHNNGAFGVDCATATPLGWERFVEGLTACGVTSVLPTIITAPLPALKEAASHLHVAMQHHPSLLGLHLEGPFLAPAKCGAHQPSWLLSPGSSELDELLDGPMKAVLKLITLAPEQPNALRAITRLTQAGLKVSLGHSNADAQQMRAGVRAGARLVTHLFNAQSALGHRAIGAPGVALTDPCLSPCVIVDGVHVAPELLQIIFASCPRAIAVTDSIPLAGLAAGATLPFGGASATLAADGVGRRADGTIAGAAITLDEGVRRLISFGIAPEIALAAATSRPASAIGFAGGRIVAGAPADLVWWSDAFQPLQVWRAGMASTKETEKTKPRGTEIARAELLDLETRDTTSIIELFLNQELAALQALQNATSTLARLADEAAARLRAGGRLFYVGAGTSGRLGFLDAVECRPTFGIEPGLIIPLLAGGANAFIQAAEGAEDDVVAAECALDEHGFKASDLLVGIAASGSTPFTLAALRHAARLGGMTAAIVNNPESAMARLADIAVEIDSGPEIIAGSTRLSAGTTEKIALNSLSSAVMIRLGKTYGPYMVDMLASNAKLRRRAVRMVRQITGVDEPTAEQALQESDMHVKLAVLVLKTHLSPALARTRLEAAGGSLRGAMAEWNQKQTD